MSEIDWDNDNNIPIWRPDQAGATISGKIIEFKDASYGKLAIMDTGTVKLAIPLWRVVLARLFKNADIKIDDLIAIRYTGMAQGAEHKYGMYQLKRL